MKRICGFISSLLVVFTSSYTSAQTHVSAEDKKKIEDYFQSSLGGTLQPSQVEIQPSKIDGLVEIYSQGSLMYFDTKTQLLFIGEIYTKAGESLTKASIKNRQLEKLARLPEPALILNKGNGYRKIIEFTDPDCPHCRKANEFLSSHSVQLERHIYFDTRLHPNANAKIIHILCAADPTIEFQKVYSDSVTKLNHCDFSAKAAAQLEKTSIEMAVSGTPTFFIGENLIRGFDRQRLDDYLNPK